jgi:hypothetical protein
MQFTSRARSSGPALWGGIKRKTVPVNLALTGTQTLVNVIDHQTARETIDPEALVDWPRMKTVAQSIGTQLVADDEVFMGLETKPQLHFRVHRQEIPKAPRKVDLPKFLPHDQAKSKITRDAIIRLSSQMRKLVMIKNSRRDNLTMQELTPKDVLQASRAVVNVERYADKGHMKLDMIDVPVGEFITGPMYEDEYHDVIVEVKKSRPVDIIRLYAFAYAERQNGNVARKHEVQKHILGLDTDPSSNYVWLKNLIEAVVPADILVRTYQLGNIVNPGSGVVWVNQLRKFLRFSHSSFQEDSLIKCFHQSLAEMRVVGRLAEEVSLGLGDFEFISTSHTIKSRGVRKKLAHPLTFFDGLSELIQKHAVYWHNRYLSNFTNTVQERVKRATAAKVMRNICLDVDNETGVKASSMRIANVLTESTVAYIRKRLLLGGKMPVIPDYQNEGLLQYATKLDNIIRLALNANPDVSVYSVAVYLESEVQEFVKDFQQLLDNVITKSDHNFLGDYETGDYQELKNNPPIQERNRVDLQVKVEKPVPEQPVVGLIDMAILNRKPVIQQQLVNLVDELEDENIDVNDVRVKLIIQKYDKMVPPDKVEKIRQKILIDCGEMIRNKRKK